MTTTTNNAMIDADLLERVAEIVSAYVSSNSVSPTDLSALISNTHSALRSLSSAQGIKVVEELTPAVPIKKSITPDYVICLDDGKKFKSMKRHLAGLGMTPDQYRAKWGLPSDYPMVAPNYSELRSSMAKSVGLGGKRPTQTMAPAKGTRKSALN